MSGKIKHYTLTRILKENADYNLIYGERSNGKTTAVEGYGLEDYVKSGYKNQLAIIRRWDTDFKGKNGEQMFTGIIIDWLKEWTNGEFNDIMYQSSRWYLVHYDENGERDKKMETPFAIGFSISGEEHYKSTSYPNIKTILFDEFITRSYYLPDEFIKFQNLLSTIIRLRDDVKIFMCGNTVNKYGCPYYNEMGLTGIKNQKQGTIDIYRYGNSDLKVAVEYSDMPTKTKPSNKYFAFNNPKLKMITNGGWEIDIYPHLPEKFLPKNILYVYYIEYDGEIIQGNIIRKGTDMFVFYHKKTTPIKDDNKQLVYTPVIRPEINYRTNILKPYGDLDRKIYSILSTNKVFYQSNDVGEVVYNYYKWCKQN